MSEIAEQSYGYHPNGREVFVFTLRNNKGTEARVTNYGAIIMALKIKKDNGRYNDIVLGFDTPQEYWSDAYLHTYPYYGAAIGRYANRIFPAAITIDGTTYPLNSEGAICQLHGGGEGFDKKVWDVVSTSDNKLVLEYNSPDGEEGFPGNLKTQISFELSDEDAFSYEYTAVTDKPTAVNLTHHSYFNLNNGKGTISNHFLKINASQYLEQDGNYCTTGTLADVAGTRNDFRNYRQTGALPDPETGIDISFPLDRQGIEHIAAEAYTDDEAIKLEVYTTEPLVHLYNSFGAPDITGKNGQAYSKCSGFCFETQVHPNAINIPGFPNTIVRPGETYRTKTIYKLTKK